MSNNDRYIGGLWNNISRATGARFMKGSITVNGVEQKIVIFKNNRKLKKMHPDYTIMKYVPLETDIMEYDDGSSQDDVCDDVEGED